MTKRQKLYNNTAKQQQYHMEDLVGLQIDGVNGPFWD